LSSTERGRTARIRGIHVANLWSREDALRLTADSCTPEKVLVTMSLSLIVAFIAFPSSVTPMSPPENVCPTTWVPKDVGSAVRRRARREPILVKRVLFDYDTLDGHAESPHRPPEEMNEWLRTWWGGVKSPRPPRMWRHKICDKCFLGQVRPPGPCGEVSQGSPARSGKCGWTCLVALASESRMTRSVLRQRC
jgi:hypothetical protein